MTRAFSAFHRYFRRSSESGQSVVLLALGFIALAGFVGITTDISLMFVRYAQLSRAVDSAAIAAANQMRQDRSNASVQLAARQFIEFYGLSPEQVIVDTCLTTNFADPDLCTEDQAKLVRVRAYFRQPTVFLRLLGVESFDMWVAATSQTAALDVVIVMDVSESMANQTAYSDWAKTEKLSDTPGVIAKTTNYGTIYRPTTTNEIINRLNLVALGLEDGVVASNKLWTEWGKRGTAPLPGLLKNEQAVVNGFLTYYRYDPAPPGTIGIGEDKNGTKIGDLVTNGGYIGEPTFRVDFNNTYFKTGADAVEHARADCRVRFYPRARAIDLYEPPQRMLGERFADGTYINYLNLLKDPKVKLQISPDPTIVKASDKTLDRFDGFVPAYNFYGCCNDPDGDKSFDDLVCQPFKQVRNATFDFLERIDFLRGDRAAFVTYDRTAVLINPYNYTSGSDRPGAMLDNKKDAYLTLKNLIGVRAEPYFYAMTPKAGGGIIPYWEKFSAGVNPQTGAAIDLDYTKQGYDATKASNLEAINYPVFDNCSFQNASLDETRSLFPKGLQNASVPSEVSPEPSIVTLTMGYDKNWANWKTNGFSAESIISNPATNPTVTTRTSFEYRIEDVSYEYWAECRNGNIGAALREANNALLNPSTSRRFGTIWIIILMSDGGAGASDPVRRNGEKLNAAQPYVKNTKTGQWGVPGEYGAFGLCPTGTPSNPGELALYGNDSQRLSDTSFAQAATPFCADEDPASRHTCDFRPLLTLPSNTTNRDFVQARVDPMQDNKYVPKNLIPAGELPANPDDDDVKLWNKMRDHLYDVDIGPKKTVNVNGFNLPQGGCEALYDVEDYARDWADYIAIANLGSSAGGNAQVPTIFTIGFNLAFATKTDNDAAKTMLVSNTSLPINDPANITKAQENVYVLCRRNLDKCLGEQLLRYIADIGDNNRIDNDFYQDMMYEWYHFEIPGYDPGDSLYYALNGKVGPLGETFGARDACQTQVDLSGNPIIPINNTYDTNGNNKLDGVDISSTIPGYQDSVYNYLDNDARGETIGSSINNQSTEFGREWGQLRGNVSCGNYYFSPTAEELQFVFDDIASRMFTRLSR